MSVDSFVFIFSKLFSIIFSNKSLGMCPCYVHDLVNFYIDNYFVINVDITF